MFHLAISHLPRHVANLNTPSSIITNDRKLEGMDRVFHVGTMCEATLE
jgi:hypothetical protein